MASTNIHHKYAESDMDEIRQIRYVALMAYKMQDKSKRLDKITKAILPDIKWDRIAPNIHWDDLNESEPEVVALNNAVTAFREELAQKLKVIIHKKANYALDTVREAYDPHIHEAGISMAQKYYARSKKSGKRHKPRSKQQNTNIRETPSTPHRHVETSHNTPSPSKPTARVATTPTSTWTPPTRSTTTQTSPPPTRIASSSPPQSTPRIPRTPGVMRDTTQRGVELTTGNNDLCTQTTHQRPKPTSNRASIQPTLKDSFKVRKSTKPKHKI